MKKLFKYMKPYRKYFISALVLLIIYSVFIAAAPMIEGLITTKLKEDVANISNNVPGAAISFSYILGIIKILLLIYIGNVLTGFYSQYLLTNGIQNTMRDLRNEVQVKITKLPVSYYDKRKVGDILSIISNDIDTISNAMQQSFSKILSAAMTITLALVMMYSINVKMAVLATLIIPGTLLIIKIITSKSKKLFRNQQMALGSLNGYIQERYSGVSEIKLYNKEEESIEEFSVINDDLCDNGFKAQFISGLMSPLISLLTYLIMIAVIMIGMDLIMIDALKVGLLQAFIRYMWQLNDPLQQITQLSSALQSASAASRRVFEFLGEDEEIPEVKKIESAEELKGNVQFENVSFGYTKDNILINDLNVDVKEGQMIAIVGPTGERVIIVMGAVCVIKSRVSGTLNKYISCIA